jgi:short subunit dehydrogenase-like uncharacterized protein
LNGTILIYGATGYTGKLIAKAAADTPRSAGAQSGKSQSVAFVAIGIKLALIVLGNRYV